MFIKKDKDFNKYGTNTSCYLNKLGNENILVDCGSGVINAIDYLKNQKEINLLITHPHFDHIVGIVELVTLCKDSMINIYGDNIKDSLDKFMGPPYWPIEVSKLKNVKIFDIKDEFNIGDVVVNTMESNHPGGCTLYKLTYDNKKIVFAFDFNHGDGYDKKLGKFANGCDILLYDGALTIEEYQLHSNWGHSTWQEGLKIAKDNNVNKLIVTHHNYLNNDLFLDNMEKELKKNNCNYCFSKELDSYEY